MAWGTLMFFGTRVIPVICIAGAVHIACTEIMRPLTPEQLEAIESKRRRTKTRGNLLPPPVHFQNQNMTGANLLKHAPEVVSEENNQTQLDLGER